MNKLKKLTIIALVIFTASCTTNLNVAKVFFDKNMDIETTNYKTFAWLTENKILAKADNFNPVMKVRVDKSIEQAFILKGYTLISDAEKADFTITYTVGSRDKITVNNYPAFYDHNLMWRRSFFGYHSLMTPPIRQYTEGKLAIDVFDVKSHQPAWHGWSVKRLTKADKKSSDHINEVVGRIIEQFN